MKMKVVNKKKLLARILEIIVILETLIITPKAIHYANELRGYKAFGGEYLIPILGLLAILIIETICEEFEKTKRGGKHANK